jgi:hypothetical protein
MVVVIGKLRTMMSQHPSKGRRVLLLAIRPGKHLEIHSLSPFYRLRAPIYIQPRFQVGELVKTFSGHMRHPLVGNIRSMAVAVWWLCLKTSFDGVKWRHRS